MFDGPARRRHPRAHGRPHARPQHVPQRAVAIDIDPHYSDQLWVKDSRFENVSKAVVVISNEKNADDPGRLRERGLRERAGVRAVSRERQDATPAPAPIYRVKNFNYGLVVAGARRDAATSTRSTTPTPLRALPDAAAAGDRAAAADRRLGQRPHARRQGRRPDRRHRRDPEGDRHASRALFPQRLLHRPQHDRAEARHGAHRAASRHDPARSARFHARLSRASARRRPVLEAPRGGTNIVSGIGIYTGGDQSARDGHSLDGGRAVAHERRAVPRRRRHAICRPRSDPRSTTPAAAARRSRPAAGARSIRASGSPTAAAARSPTSGRRTRSRRAGFYVSDTTTPGHVYELSAEHHLFNEIKLDRVENWDFNAPQTEEEAPTSPEAVSLEINWSKNITIANYHALPRDAQPRAVPGGGAHLQLVGHPLPQRPRQRRERLRHLRRERLRHVPAREQVPLRERDSGRDAPPGGPRARVRGDRHSGEAAGDWRRRDASAVVAASASVEKTGGRLLRHLRRRRRRRRARSISSITISTASSPGRRRAVSTSCATIRWIRSTSPSTDRVICWSQSSDGPEGTVYSFGPAAPADQITVLQPQAATPHPDAAAVSARQRLGQRRIRQPARSRHLRVHNARADVRAAT